MVSTALRSSAWFGVLALLAPLAFGLTPPAETLDLPEVVVRGIDQTRLEAQRAGVLPLEAPRTAQAAVRVDVSTQDIPAPQLRAAPPVQSPGCAYRNPVTGALARAGGGAGALYKSGLDRLVRGELDAAAHFLAKLRETHPADPLADDAAFHLAEIQRRSGRDDDAVAFYRLVHGGYAPQARYRLAWMLEARGRGDEARALWQEMRADPTSPFRAEALYRVGIQQLRAGNHSAAAQDLEAALGVEEPPPAADVVSNALFALGLAQRNLGQRPRAEKTLLRFLLEYPDHPSAAAAQVALGWTLLEQQRPQEARRRFGWVLEGGPEPDLAARALYGRVRAAADLGEMQPGDTALAALEAAAPDGPWVGWARADLAWLAFRRADFAAARQRYRAAVDAWQGRGEDVPRYMIAESLYLLGRYAAADQAYRQVAASSPLRPTALHRAGLCQLLEGDAAGAEALFVQLLHDHPGYPEVDQVRLWLGEALTRQQRGDEAQRAYRSVSVHSAAHPQAVYGLAWLAFEAERWEEAAGQFSRYLQSAPEGVNRDEALLTLARAHFNRRQLRAALDALDLLQARSGDPAYDAAARYYRGWMLTRGGREAEGRDVLNELLRADPAGSYAARAHSTLAWLDYAAADYIAALNHFERVAELDSDPALAAEARGKRADALFNLQRFEDALVAYRALGDSPEARYGAALCQQRLGRVAELEQAAEQFARAYGDDPRAADLYLALGRLLAAAGAAGDAARAYQRAAELSPDPARAAEAKLEAARSWIRAGEDPAAARVLDELGKGAGPVAEAALRERALVLERNGDAPAASAAWQQFAARTEGKTRAEALATAARWSRLADRWPEAEQQLRAALDACPEDQRVLHQRLLVDLGETQWLAGAAAPAQQTLVQAAALGTSPQGQRALLLLGRAQESAGQDADAVDTYLRLGYLYSMQDEAVAEAWLRAATLLQQSGDTPRAQRLLQKVEAEGPPPSADRARQRLAADDESAPEEGARVETNP